MNGLNNGIPAINGVEYAWADIKVNIAGLPLVGITGIDYDDEQELANNYGAGRVPISVSKGRISCTAKLSLYKSEVLALQRMSPRGRIQDLLPFDIVVAYIPEQGLITTDVIRNCRFKKNSRAWKEGDMSQIVELEILPTHIDWGK